MTVIAAPRILVAGSINTDLVMHVASAPEAGETVTGLSFETFGGGKGANQAVAAARSGAAVAILGGTGDDDFGRQRRYDLEREGISLQAVSLFPKLASGVAIILVESGGQNRIAYVPGATWGVTAELAVGALEEWQPDVVLATLEHRGDTLEALWQAAKTAGIPVICNATPEPAVGRDLAMSADVLIVNEVEAIELLGEPVDSEGWPAVANALRLAGPEIVVITLGAQGALVSMAQETVSIPSLRVEVIDTTGAGDAFCGAFSAALARGATPGEAARTGVVAGALAVTKAGAQPSMPRRAEIEHALNTIDR